MGIRADIHDPVLTTLAVMDEDPAWVRFRASRLSFATSSTRMPLRSINKKRARTRGRLLAPNRVVSSSSLRHRGSGLGGRKAWPRLTGLPPITPSSWATSKKLGPLAPGPIFSPEGILLLEPFYLFPVYFDDTLKAQDLAKFRVSIIYCDTGDNADLLPLILGLRTTLAVFPYEILCQN